MDSLETTNWLLIGILVVLIYVGVAIEKYTDNKNDDEYEDDDRTPLKEYLNDIRRYLIKLEEQQYMTDKEIKEEREWRIEKEEMEMKEFEEAEKRREEDLTEQEKSENYP